MLLDQSFYIRKSKSSPQGNEVVGDTIWYSAENLTYISTKTLEFIMEHMHFKKADNQIGSMTCLFYEDWYFLPGQHKQKRMAHLQSWKGLLWKNICNKYGLSF